MTSSSVPQMLPSLQTWGRALFPRAAADNARSVIISARIASPLAVVSPEEQAEFLEGFGLKPYFTARPKQARAWTIHIGDTGPQAAGVIHTDFEEGFIRAETIAFDDYVALRDEARAREAGKLRAEGKAYVVKDGDVMNFLFS